ncbi:hypothetical protein [Hyphomicrobium sulfonivorans]|uniref:hypothetical protein n=1 Tax=Hyphomicrobium sulfonivorans TaxID=121290 RepID=UPI000AE35CC1|nr:hypothetical protein [Hyphomicrobium sulfonivorans]
MSGTLGFLVGVALIVVGLGGLGMALHQMMIDATVQGPIAGGLVTFVAAAFASLLIIR